MRIRQKQIILASIVLLAILSFYLLSDALVRKNISATGKAVREAESSQTIEVADGETISLEAKPVMKKIGNVVLDMYGYNGQIPGPLIQVRQGDSVYVNFTNNLDMETTVHWHGIRLENRFDGVPNLTQDPVKPGQNFLYKLDFQDDGVYWYHPHVREDLQQELGLYGNIIVEPSQVPYNTVDRKVALFLDDVRIDDGSIKTSNDYTTFALMGRFGNTMLVNGQTDYKLDLKKNDVVRLYLTDAANTRTFNFSIQDTRLKVVGGDSGRYEKESFASNVVISPGERYIVEAAFTDPGIYKILHRTPSTVYILGTVTVSDSSSVSNNYVLFDTIKEIDVIGDINIRKYLVAEPDYKLDLTVDMTNSDVMSQSPMMGMDHSAMGHGMMTTVQPIEWEEENQMMNAMSTSENTKWIIRDSATGKKNGEVEMKAKVGDYKKIRIFNDPNSPHPMQHPIHLHGQRFLILSQDGSPNKNMVWKDTVLVPTGSTVDILVDFSNPGTWPIHCHISEHLEAGMMANFFVAEKP